jgi:hypothetical protein
MSRTLALLLAGSSLLTTIVAFAPSAEACSPGDTPFTVSAHPAAGTRVPSNVAGVQFRTYGSITSSDLHMFDSKGAEVPSETRSSVTKGFGGLPFVAATVPLTVGETYVVRGTITGTGSRGAASTVPAEGSFVAAPEAAVPITLGALQVIGGDGVTVDAPGFEPFQGFAEFEIAAYEASGSYWPERSTSNRAEFPVSCDGDLGNTCNAKMEPGSRRLEAKAFIPGQGEVASAQSVTADLTCGSNEAEDLKGFGCNASGQSGTTGSSLFLMSLVATLVLTARRRNARA